MAKTVKTLGQLKKSGYKVLPIREELRKNLIAKINLQKIYFQELKDMRTR